MCMNLILSLPELYQNGCRPIRPTFSVEPTLEKSANCREKWVFTSKDKLGPITEMFGVIPSLVSRTVAINLYALKTTQFVVERSRVHFFF